MRWRCHRLLVQRTGVVECALCGGDIVPEERIRCDVYGSMYHAKCGLRVLRCMHRNVKRHPKLYAVARKFGFFLQYVHPRFLGMHLDGDIQYRAFPRGGLRLKPNNFCCPKCGARGGPYTRHVLGQRWCNACGKVLGAFIKKGQNIERTMRYLLDTNPGLGQFVRADVKKCLLDGK